MQRLQKLLAAGSILVAGTALANEPAAAQPVAGEPSALGNVYTTIDWGDLSVTEWAAKSFRADYTFEKGKIEGVRTGNEVDGFWTQATSDRACSTSRDGSYHYGRMTFTFNPALDSFEGRWGYCDETPYATWNGTLIRRGAVKTTATKKPARRTTGSASAAAQPVAGEPSALGNVYTTIDWGDLSVTEWAAKSFRADYTFEKGKIEGVRTGNEVDGFWTQATSDRACSTPRDGSYHYGRMTFTFNPALDSFEGRWGYCDETPYATWNGTLIRRGAVTAPTNAASAQTSADTPRASPAGTPGMNPVGRIIDGVARAAEDEADAKAKEAARKAARSILDRPF